jgi:predicted acyltransferase
MRFVSLDVFRGMTIAAMILVNMGSVSGKVYPSLDHAKWHGCTFTDLIFPFFLFIIGVAMAFSLEKYTGEGKKPTKDVYLKILKRSVILFLLGLMLNGFYNYDFSTIRIMGVLQRISLTYLFAAVIICNFQIKTQVKIAGGILIAYWLIMMLVPVPEFGAGNLTLPESNFAAYFDRSIIPQAHLHGSFKKLGDPEGLFSTFPAIVSVLFGYFAGIWVKNKPRTSHTSMDLVIMGLCGLVIGILWDFWFPINKQIWTSSYVMFTTGWALLLLAFCFELIEVRKSDRWSKPFEIMGLNAIFAFVGSVLLIKICVKTNIGDKTTYEWLYQNLFASWLGELNGSLILSLITLLFWWFVVYLMYQKRWFLKV